MLLNLQNQKNLELLYFKIETVPKSFGPDLSDLEVLNLSYCKNLPSFPNSFVGLIMLGDLNHESCGIRTLLETFMKLRNLAVLNLSTLGELTELPGSFGVLGT